MRWSHSHGLSIIHRSIWNSRRSMETLLSSRHQGIYMCVYVFCVCVCVCFILLSPIFSFGTVLTHPTTTTTTKKVQLLESTTTISKKTATLIQMVRSCMIDCNAFENIHNSSLAHTHTHTHTHTQTQTTTDRTGCC